MKNFYIQERLILIIMVLLLGISEGVWAKIPSDSSSFERIITETGLVISKTPEAKASTIKHENQWTFYPIPSIRSMHTDIILPDGRVMLAGGFYYDANGEGIIPKGVDIFDPLTKTWEQGPELNFGRHYFEPLKLANGKTVLIGGSGYTGWLKNIEIFNPASLSFSVSQEMNIQRSGFAAVEMADGRILIAGGVDIQGNFLSSSEIYDPENDNWIAVESSFSSPRSIGKLIKLLDGRIMYIGGFKPPSTSMKVDIFDPVTMQWSIAESLFKPRQQFNIALLPDGRVMVIGGIAMDNNADYNCTEIYDPVTNTWILGPELSMGRSNSTQLVLPSGEILIAGGFTNQASAGNSIEIYDPLLEQWKDFYPMNEPRNWFTFSLLPSGEFFAAGGFYFWFEFSQTAEVTRRYYAELNQDSEIDFGILPTNQTASAILNIENNGNAWAIIHDVSFSNAAFSFSADLPVIIFPGTSEDLVVDFAGNQTEALIEEVLWLNLDKGNGPVIEEIVLKVQTQYPESTNNISQENLKLFPIPARDAINISSKSEITTIQVFDISGRLVIEKHLNGKDYILDTTSLRNGCYFLKAFTRDETFSIKFNIVRN
jgi:hypothetical protein